MRFTDPVRNRLAELVEERDTSLAALSRLVGKNAAWMQQFMERGTPKALPERERRILSAHFGVAESELGGSPDIGHRCRICTANDIDALIEEVAERMWEQRRDLQMGDPAWADAGLYWQQTFREYARAMVDVVRG